MEKYDWSRLTHLQVGRFAEYFVKMEFTLYGFEVYQAEVDDKGIDFVICKGHERYFDIQVKSIRGLNYVFFPKRCFELRENLLAAVVVFLPAQMPGDISNSVLCMAESERAVCQPRLRVANAKEQTGMGLELVAEELRIIGGVSL
jgi:hypothetical protein